MSSFFDVLFIFIIIPAEIFNNQAMIGKSRYLRPDFINTINIKAKIIPLSHVVNGILNSVRPKTWKFC